MSGQLGLPNKTIAHQMAEVRCDAGFWTADVCFVSKGDFAWRPGYFRLSPSNRHPQHRSACPKSANWGPEQVQQTCEQKAVTSSRHRRAQASAAL
jgi:hypothetical protein